LPVLIQACFTPESNITSPTIILQSMETILKSPEAAEEPVALCLGPSEQLHRVMECLDREETCWYKLVLTLSTALKRGSNSGIVVTFPFQWGDTTYLKDKQKEDKTEIWNPLSFMF